MRQLEWMNRRAFLGRSALTFLSVTLGFLGLVPKTWAEIDYFTGTDYVGKTRAGRYRDFYINFFKPMRRINPAAWKLRVFGLCENPRSFTLNELKALPQHAQVSRLKCVECWSAKAEWQGLRVSDLEKIVCPLPGAAGAVFRCADTYVEYLDRESLNHRRALLAYSMDRQPLTDEHGFPLRIIVPFKYGYKNPKSIVEIEYVAHSEPGTWSRLGPYSVDGTILPGYDHPLDRNKKRRRISGGEVLD
ncbi:MAG: molybdopterin-dependent oxidoreductase [Nitrospinales bacterium]